MLLESAGVINCDVIPNVEPLLTNENVGVPIEDPVKKPPCRICIAGVYKL